MGAVAPQSGPGVEWLSEAGLDSVEEPHVLALNAVKAQDPRVVVQVNPDPVPDRIRDLRQDFVGQERVAVYFTAQGPGFIVVSEQAVVAEVISANVRVRHGHIHASVLPHIPLQLKVAAARQPIAAQDLPQVLEFVWVLGFQVSLGQAGHFSTSRVHMQPLVSSVSVHGDDLCVFKELLSGAWLGHML